MPRITKSAVFDLGKFKTGLAKSIGVQNLFLFDQASGRIVDFMNPQLIASPLASGMSAVPDTEGAAIKCNGSSGAQSVTLPTPMQTATGNNLVVIGRIKANAAQTNNPGQAFGFSSSLGSNPSFGIGFDNSNPPKAGLTYLTSAGAGTLAYSQSALNTWVTVAAQITNITTFSASGANYAWINGQPATTGQGSLGFGSGANTMNELVFGGQHRSSGYLRWLNGAVEWAAIIAVPQTPMPDAWHWQLYADDFPYNLFSNEPDFVISAAGGTTVACSLGTVTQTGLAASVAISTDVAGNLATVTGAGNAASIRISTDIACALGTASIAGQSAAVSVSTNVDASLATISDAGLSASVSVSTDVSCAEAQVTCAGLTATVLTATTIDCALASVAVAGLSASVLQPTDVSCIPAGLTSAGLSADIVIPTAVSCNAAQITITGLNATVTSASYICSASVSDSALFSMALSDTSSLMTINDSTVFTMTLTEQS
jgi:hypothetical protein